jgi:glycosyltransferase involved in cell wall biosynthesis
MRILQVIARVPSPPVDGGAMYVHYITESLLKDNHDVHLTGFISNKHKQDTSQLNGAVWHLKDGLYKKYYPWAFIGSELRQLPVTVSYRMNKAIFQQALETVSDIPDVILLEGVFVGYFIDNLRRSFPGIPIVLRSSNVEYQVLERNAKVAGWYYKWMYGRQAKLMKRFEARVMQEVDGMTAITESDRRTLSAMNPAVPSYVVTAGTTFPPLDNAVPKNQNLIGCIADWSWQPNRDGLQWFVDKVWPLLYRDNPAIEMEVAGRKMPSSLQASLEKAGIRYLGFVDSADDFRQQLSVIVIPLLSGGGMKLKTVEAMGSGVPFVSTSIGVEGIDVEHTVHALITDDPSDFAMYTLELIKNNELRKVLTDQSYKLARNSYDWQGVTRKMVSFLEDEIIVPKEE